MQSQSALTEPVSLNLARFFLLDPVNILQILDFFLAQPFKSFFVKIFVNFFVNIFVRILSVLN